MGSFDHKKAELAEKKWRETKTLKGLINEYLLLSENLDTIDKESKEAFALGDDSYLNIYTTRRWVDDYSMKEKLKDLIRDILRDDVFDLEDGRLLFSYDDGDGTEIVITKLYKTFE